MGQMSRLQKNTAEAPREKQTLFVGQFRKTKLCRFHETGRCRYAEKCPFAHSAEELEDLPDLRKTSICKNWQQGCCLYSPDRCAFAHGKEELRKTPPFGRKKSQGEGFDRRDSFEGSDAYASTSEGFQGSFESDRQSSSSFDEEQGTPTRSSSHVLDGDDRATIGWTCFDSLVMEGTPIVLDNGSGSIKAGFAGECEPRVVHDNIFTALRASRHVPGGEDFAKALHANTYRFPVMDHGIVSQWEGLLEVIQAAMDEMKVEPERHPILLTEACGTDAFKK
eukprot:symbB.v1.2.018878.t1/scaffold1500.1/size115144/2